MSRKPEFHTEKITFPDPKIRPANHDKLVTRYVVSDEIGIIWLNGHPFGRLSSMLGTQGGNTDCRLMLNAEDEHSAWWAHAAGYRDDWKL